MDDEAEALSSVFAYDGFQQNSEEWIADGPTELNVGLMLKGIWMTTV